MLYFHKPLRFYYSTLFLQCSNYSSDLTLENLHFDSTYRSTDKSHLLNISFRTNGIRFPRTNRCCCYLYACWCDSAYDCHWHLCHPSSSTDISIKIYSFTNIHAFMFQGCCLFPTIIQLRGNWKRYKKHQRTNEQNHIELAKLRHGWFQTLWFQRINF